ncbi:hypothetical protein EJ05DRAFT_538089 [Pseudovirgaria hyperparasitica]|uniref:DUF7779 domain-containing protein n=1 Tax=Pseudovirgaria hyperparasitica TaxID=470096 RepID=A0A6A6W8B2_9PEZI|nr:uncharacterized protein EJ05DRAFT_538089 [Pseudovirgaria hyperparasitica]KAF2758785.1 hypothetical protein EJ05DRAFT_538089 [Pseudovirgaria hyperparasitica]
MSDAVTPITVNSDDENTVRDQYYMFLEHGVRVFSSKHKADGAHIFIIDDKAGVHLSPVKKSLEKNTIRSPSSNQDRTVPDMSTPTTSMEEISLPRFMPEHVRNRGFYGRKDVLRQIDQVFLRDEESPDGAATPSSHAGDPPEELKAFVICGIEGSGKTEIANEYMHSRRTRFDAVFWVDGATTQTLNTGFHDMADELGLEADNSLEGSVITREIVKDWLSNPRGKVAKEPQKRDSDITWLLVFDNADDPDIIHDFWPTGRAGSVLVTRRYPFAKEGAFGRFAGLDLPPLPVEEAGRFLQMLSQREEEEGSLDTCRKIVTNLGCLPATVVLIGYEIRSTQLTLKENEEYFRGHAKYFHEVVVPDLTEPRPVAATSNIDSLSDPAYALLRVLSVLDADKVPEEILTTGGPMLDLEHYPRTNIDYVEAREELIESSRIVHNVKPAFVRIHRRVQYVVGCKMSIEELQAVYDAGVTLVTSVWPFANSSNLNQVDRLRKVQKYLPHLYRLRGLIEQQYTLAALQPHIGVSALFNEASWYFILQPTGYGMLEAQRFARLSQQVLDRSTREPKDEKLSSKLLADSYRYQGISGIHRDDPSAISNCTKWLEILVDRIAKYGLEEDKRTLPIAYNEIGMALMRIPDEAEAVKSWTMSCDALVANTPPDALVFPFPWVHRGIVAAQAGDADAAEALVAPILAAREEKLGIDDTTSIETGVILVFMGNIRLIQGRKAEAYEYHKRAVSILEVTCGENSVQASLGYYRLAVDQFDRGEFEAAADNLKKKIIVYGDSPWFEPQRARLAWKRGRALLALGRDNDKEEADYLLEKAMEMRRELAPGDDRDEQELVDEDWDRLVYYFWR